MPRFTAPFLTLLLGGALAAGLVACGEEEAKLLPGETAREITANLDTVQQLADEGDCEGAEDAARQVSEQVEALTGVDSKLLRALSEGANRLGEVVSNCVSDDAGEETTEETIPAITESEPAKPAEEDKPQKPKKEKEEDTKEPEETTTTTPATPPGEATPTPPATPPTTPPPGGTGAPPGGLSPEGEEGEG